MSSGFVFVSIAYRSLFVCAASYFHQFFPVPYLSLANCVFALNERPYH